MKRPLLLASLAASLVLPAPALGATALRIGPTAVRGYDVTLRVGGGGDLGVLTLSKARGGSVQTHTYELHGFAVNVRRGTVRGHGVRLRWRGSGGRKLVPYGAGCTGSLRVQPGRLTGTLDIELPYAKYYGTLRKHHLAGRTETPVGVRCPSADAPRA